MNTAPIQVAAKCHQPASPHFWSARAVPPPWSANGCSTTWSARAVPPPWSAKGCSTPLVSQKLFHHLVSQRLFHPPGQLRLFHHIYYIDYYIGSDMCMQQCACSNTTIFRFPECARSNSMHACPSVVARIRASFSSSTTTLSNCLVR